MTEKEDLSLLVKASLAEGQRSFQAKRSGGQHLCEKFVAEQQEEPDPISDWPGSVF